MGSKIIQRFDVGARMSEMSVYNGIAHLAGQVAEDASADTAGQTRQVLAAIDALPLAALADGGGLDAATLELLSGVGAACLGDVRRLPRSGLARRQARQVIDDLAIGLNDHAVRAGACERNHDDPPIPERRIERTGWLLRDAQFVR